MKNKNILIIGGGIHGTTMAIEFAEKGCEVIILESKEDILMGSSYATHNRLHLGYHYPRSPETIKECILGYEYFEKNLNDCIERPDFYYAIEKNNSHLSASDYKSNLEAFGLECKSRWPNNIFLDKENIEDCFKVKEACFNIWSLKHLIKKKFAKLKINVICNYKIKKVDLINRNNLSLESVNGLVLDIKADLIINCTYTNTNNLLTTFSCNLDLIKYKFEETEIAVVESSLNIPALTVMDGPFITILPYTGKTNHYLVYDVSNSVRKTHTGRIYNSVEPLKSNWAKMLEHGLKYYPCFKNLDYKYSLYGSRPIAINTDDDRSTKITKADYPIDFYSINEGKFISAPVIAHKFCNEIL